MDSAHGFGMKLLFFIGTPREAITLAPIVRATQSSPQCFEVKVCLTGERCEGLAPVLTAFEIQSSREPLVSAADGTTAQLAARMIEPLDHVLASEKPDWILVQGASTTAMVGSLVAYYRRLRTAHVEAGLRSYAKYAPFPGEMNRRMADLLADLYFVPTERCQRNLIDEGVDAKRILVTGSTGIDAMHRALQLDCDLTCGPLSGIPFEKRVLLVGANARESFAGALEEICTAFRRVAISYGSEIHIVYVDRLDPGARESVDALLGDLENVTLAPLLDYVSFVHLLNRCHLVLTDSGGIQEEACSLGKPVLLLNSFTERLEALAEGTAKVVGTGEASIVKQLQLLLDDASTYAAMARPSKLYGDGRAAARICYEFLRREEYGDNLP
jgi:UDP-N-acetylglucosamine 2-epimerase (non-hydrolysing)